LEQCSVVVVSSREKVSALYFVFLSGNCDRVNLALYDITKAEMQVISFLLEIAKDSRADECS
jgi:hypothetical protein